MEWIKIPPVIPSLYGKTLCSKRLYLLYRFHRNGLGQLLMNEVLAAGRQSRVVKLFLKVQDANQSAIDFYLHNGFRVVGEEPFRAGTRDYKVLVMRLAL